MTLTFVLKKGFYPKEHNVKYESPITYHLKAMANVKVFADKPTNRGTGQKLCAPDLSMHKNTERPVRHGNLFNKE